MGVLQSTVVRRVADASAACCSPSPASDALVPSGATQLKLIEVDDVFRSENTSEQVDRNKRRKRRRLATLLEGDVIPSDHQLGHKLLEEWTELVDPNTNSKVYRSEFSGDHPKPPTGFDQAPNLLPAILNSSKKKKRKSYWIRVEDVRRREYYFDVLSRSVSWSKPEGYKSPTKRARTSVDDSSLRKSLRLSLRASAVGGGGS